MNSPDASWSRPRGVVFSAQFGSTDLVLPPLAGNPELDFVVMASSNLRVPPPWKLRRVDAPSNVSTDRLRNRWCKIHASRLLSDYDFSIYVDTHLQVVGDLQPLISNFLESRADIGLLSHPYSRSVEQEVARSLRTGRITEDDHRLNWPTQSRRQAEAGFRDDYGLYFCTVVLRHHARDSVRILEDEWWLELSQGVTRDQVALPYVLWKTDAVYQAFLLDWGLAPYFRRWRHLESGTRRERIIRFFDARVDLVPSYRWVLRTLRPLVGLATLRGRWQTAGARPVQTG
jgi:hypothetical protein